MKIGSPNAGGGDGPLQVFSLIGGSYPDRSVAINTVQYGFEKGLDRLFGGFEPMFVMLKNMINSQTQWVDSFVMF